MDKDDYLDLNKKYADTHIRYKKEADNAWITIYVKEIEINVLAFPHFTVIGNNSKGKVVRVNSDEVVFNFSFPKIGVLEHKNTVVIGSKYPARQWKKAATSDNFRVFSPMSKLFSSILKLYTSNKFFVEESHFTISDIDSWFNTTYYPLKKATYLLLNGKKQAVPLSSQFFISLSHYGEGFLIWRLYKPIAEVSLDGVFKYLCPVFEQELKDYLNRREENVS
ncbi:MAG: hypothetical protein RBT52_02895 [Sulfurimonas sp.]|jgi:hypothetical protein|nr:hypothetical protein [Sulfurimonas sp.]